MLEALLKQVRMQTVDTSQSQRVFKFVLQIRLVHNNKKYQQVTKMATGKAIKQVCNESTITSVTGINCTVSNKNN